jgi:hypothetical protein
LKQHADRQETLGRKSEGSEEKSKLAGAGGVLRRATEGPAWESVLHGLLFADLPQQWEYPDMVCSGPGAVARLLPPGMPPLNDTRAGKGTGVMSVTILNLFILEVKPLLGTPERPVHPFVNFLPGFFHLFRWIF